MVQSERDEGELYHLENVLFLVLSSFFFSLEPMLPPLADVFTTFGSIEAFFEIYISCQQISNTNLLSILQPIKRAKTMICDLKISHPFLFDSLF